jgi:hypothetical protein
MPSVNAEVKNSVGSNQKQLKSPKKSFRDLVPSPITITTESLEGPNSVWQLYHPRAPRHRIRKGCAAEHQQNGFFSSPRSVTAFDPNLNLHADP